MLVVELGVSKHIVVAPEGSDSSLHNLWLHARQLQVSLVAGHAVPKILIFKLQRLLPRDIAPVEGPNVANQNKAKQELSSSDQQLDLGRVSACITCKSSQNGAWTWHKYVNEYPNHDDVHAHNWNVFSEHRPEVQKGRERARLVIWLMSNVSALKNGAITLNHGT